MDDLNWFGKMVLALAFAVSFFATQAIMGVAGAATLNYPLSPQVDTCQPIMADSTPLVFPYKSNVVINPTANWGPHSMTIKKAAWLVVPHEYLGKKVCVMDGRDGGGFLLVCEALMGHGRKEAFRAFNDAGDLYQVR